MPIYSYRCPDGHVHDRLRKWAHCDWPLPCCTCGQDTQRILTAPHVLPDGVYSHEPNLGDPAKFERNLAGIERQKERIARQKDGENPYIRHT